MEQCGWIYKQKQEVTCWVEDIGPDGWDKNVEWKEFPCFCFCSNQIPVFMMLKVKVVAKLWRNLQTPSLSITGTNLPLGDLLPTAPRLTLIVIQLFLLPLLPFFMWFLDTLSLWGSFCCHVWFCQSSLKFSEIHFFMKLVLLWSPSCVTLDNPRKVYDMMKVRHHQWKNSRSVHAILLVVDY